MLECRRIYELAHRLPDRVLPQIHGPCEKPLVIFLLRLLLARHLVHPFEGLTLADWRQLLRRERYRIDPVYWPRALWISAQGFWNSYAERTVEQRFGAAIDAARVEAPVFVLGHYRSGTTFLHELLRTDPRFASPNRFQTFNPRTFLGTEPWLAPVVEPFMLPRRVQEDEVAYAVLTQLSPYMDWIFPRSQHGYERYLTFHDADPAEVAQWSAALVRFMKALTVKHQRPLILKSPPHTARVRLLLRLFPDARFVHIRRDPYAVFVSTIGLLKSLYPVFGLQRGPRKIDEDAVLRTYKTMYDAYFDDIHLVPPGQLIEIAYEDLEHDPLGQLRTIYDGIALGDFDEVRPALDEYIASIAGYRKNRHRPLADATREKVAEACARSFDAWGYPR
ncbi:MAG: sulfotransferase [Isosphaeraceae bacterium]|nr:sulfotransferase [Isosphaeraceae bacterium]